MYVISLISVFCPQFSRFVVSNQRCITNCQSIAGHYKLDQHIRLVNSHRRFTSRGFFLGYRFGLHSSWPLPRLEHVYIGKTKQKNTDIVYLCESSLISNVQSLPTEVKWWYISHVFDSHDYTFIRLYPQNNSLVKKNIRKVLTK